MAEEKIVGPEDEIVEIQPELENDETNFEMVEFTSDQINKLDVAIDNFKKIVGIMIKLTTPNDWVDQNGKPYLQSSGAEKIAVPFGISLANKERLKHERKDEKGPFYFYEYRCVATSKRLGRSIPAEGYRGSRDPFFAYSREKDEKGKPILKPQSEIDESRVMRAAYSNMEVNAITRLIGIRNLTWDMIEEWSKGNVTRDKVASIKYDQGMSGKSSTPESKKTRQELLEKIGDGLLALNNQDKDLAKKQLKDLTSFKGKDGRQVVGQDSLDKVSEAAAPVVWSKVKDLLKEKGLLPKEEEKS